MTASSDIDSMIRIWVWYWLGKMSMMRLMDSTAEFVCRVEKVRWPVSATRRAASTVSKSRISPIRTTSGSSRRTERRALP